MVAQTACVDVGASLPVRPVVEARAETVAAAPTTVAGAYVVIVVAGEVLHVPSKNTRKI